MKSSLPPHLHVELNNKKEHNIKMNATQKLSENQVKHLWRTADCICFDVDSTVCRNEAIDDLASFVGAGEQVQKLTREAMGGNMSFREALKTRLAIINPSLHSIEQFNKSKKCQLTPGIKYLRLFEHYQSASHLKFNFFSENLLTYCTNEKYQYI